MIKNRTLLITFFLLILTQLIYAQDTNPWSSISPEEIPNIPTENIEYSKLNIEQRQALTSEQIEANLNNIKNLNGEVNSVEAEKALNKKYDIAFQITGNSSIKNNTLVTATDKLEIQDYHKKGLIKVDEQGHITFIPSKETQEISIKKGESFSIDTSDIGKQGFREINFKMPNGETIPITGKVSFQNGEVYTSEAKINGLDVKGSSVRLFFDGEKHPESKAGYVSMNPANKKLVISSGVKDTEIITNEARVIFREDNPFVKIEKGDYLSVNAKNSEIEILNRNNKGLIPKMNIFRKNQGESSEILAEINDGPFNLKVFDDSIKEIFPGGYNSPTPLTLSYGTEQRTVMINNYGELYGISGDIERVTSHPTLKHTLLVLANSSEEISANYDYVKYNLDNLKEKFKGTAFYGTIKESDIPIIENSLELLPEEVRKSIKGMGVSRDSTAAGVASLDTQIIQIRGSHLTPLAIVHEAAHTYHAQLRQENARELMKTKGLDNNYIHNPISPFDKEWIEVAKMNYDIEFTPRTTSQGFKIRTDMTVSKSPLKADLDDVEKGLTVWTDSINQPNSEKASEPRYGLIRPYGAEKLVEDVSTYMEVIYTQPEFFKPLIDPNSEKYDPRYLQKLELLKKYGFITPETFDKIVLTEN